MNGSVSGKLDGQVEQGGKSALQLEQERLQKALARKIAEEAKEGGTQRLKGRTLDSIKAETLLSGGLRSGSARSYAVLPVHLAGKADVDNLPRWRIELHGLDGNAGPMGLDLIGDAVLGRGKEGPAAPDLDLEPFSGQKMGVSRRHVIFRPTTKHLYLIDLNSTNGTMHNGVPVGPGVARALEHNDTIMIGDLTFTLKIIARPSESGSPLAEESMTVVELLSRDGAHKAAQDKTSSQHITRRMLQGLSKAAERIPNPRQSTHSADTPPRPLPSAAPKYMPQLPSGVATPSATGDKQSTVETAQPVMPEENTPAAAKPAKIMGLRSHFGQPGFPKKQV